MGQREVLTVHAFFRPVMMFMHLNTITVVLRYEIVEDCVR